MSLFSIVVLIGFSLGVYILCLFPRTRGIRNSLLLVASVVVIYWLQPALPIHGLDFWLPTTTLALAVLGWLLTSRPEERSQDNELKTSLILIGTILFIAMTRYMSSTGVLTPSRPPQTLLIVLVLLLAAGIFFAFSRIKQIKTPVLTLAILLLLIIFIVLKLPSVTLFTSSALRGLTGQSKELASVLDIRWLGFSYISFRLIHTLRDRQTNHLPCLNLEEYLVYLLFFPAFSAGPIDRAERFVLQLRQPFVPGAEPLASGARRLVMGVFKKFVLADLLALIALNGTNAQQVQAAGWMWVLLYAYSFQIFFDFSGYTDIAIGLAALMGIRLPENFKSPYLKPNLTRFWDTWHITLTQWFRAYFFNPLARFLRTRAPSIPVWAVLFITQLSTMILVGLWHGITLNFLLWGAWHGVGLFIQNRWSVWTRPLSARVQTKPVLNQAVTLFSTFLTFTYVTLGWVWFALPSVNLSTQVFMRLFGMGGWL